mmetsp:Transcript_58347/g.96681  ORF Transcript_58347/g.96681 Transcript_58347/m.96681 type:complete len:85 (+) Transcript_58347:1214-1468(+)
MVCSGCKKFWAARGGGHHQTKQASKLDKVPVAPITVLSGLMSQVYCLMLAWRQRITCAVFHIHAGYRHLPVCGLISQREAFFLS